MDKFRKGWAEHFKSDGETDAFVTSLFDRYDLDGNGILTCVRRVSR